jgi:hypothetical protein
MVDPILGRMGPFTHTFELIEYSGQLSYSPGSNTVTGTINLTRSGQPSDVLQGPATLLKAPTNRFNLLTLPAGGWTNQAETFEFDACELKRDAARPAIYRGVLHNPSSTFRSWTLSITDTNDANGNGIPDLSDDPGVVSPSRPPVLSLSRNSTHLLLQISGVVGRTNVIERALSPVSANWEIVQSITLTNDPQTVLLPLPSEAAMFWRVRVQ